MSLSFVLSVLAALPLPPRIVTGGHQNDPLIKAGYLDATIYGADPTGVSDSTAALTAAIEDGREYALITYLPPGTYLVSSTVQAIERGASSCATFETSYGTVHHDGVMEAPTLVGPPSGPRPLIRLAANSSGFQDPANPRPVIHFVNYFPTMAGSVSLRAGAFDCMMNAFIRDVDVSVGSGNPGAIGVQFYSAQHSFMQNVSVDATGGFAGIEGAPATSVWTNLKVTGGQFGIVIDDAGGACSLAGIELIGQSNTSLSVGGCNSVVVSGFRLAPGSTGVAARLIPYAATGQTVGLGLVEGAIVTTVNQPAIVNPSGLNLTLRQVWVSGPGGIVQSGAHPTVPGSSTADLVQLYSNTDLSAPGASWVPLGSRALVNGVLRQDELVSIQRGAGPPPSDLITRHVPTRPWFQSAGVVDVTSLGADPTGFTDSTAAFRQALTRSSLVFVPRGDFSISGTLELPPGTHLFGIGGHKSRLLGQQWFPSASGVPFVRALDTTTGATALTDLTIELPNSVAQSSFEAIEWQAGRSSVVDQVSVDLAYEDVDVASAPRQLVRVLQHGGGRWYGLQASFIRSRFSNPAFRIIGIDGTTAPLTFYGANPEHAISDGYVELTNAANVRFFATKVEGSTSVFRVFTSSNVLVLGVNGDYDLLPGRPGLDVRDSSNVVAGLIGYYAFPNATSGGLTVSERAPGIDAGIGSANWCSHFQRGEVDLSAFPHCGDGVCDGLEPSSGCPADCLGDGGSVDAGLDSGVPFDAGVSDAGRAIPRWTACHFDTAPALDGSVEWDAVTAFQLSATDALLQPSAPIRPTDDRDSSALAQLGWTNEALFARVTVRDEQLVDGPTQPLYDVDGLELYLDGTHRRGASYGPFDHQLIVTATNRADPAKVAATAFTSLVQRLPDGYRVQLRVPFTALGATQGLLGFDLAINDADDGGQRESQLMWTGGATAYLDPREFGELELSMRSCGSDAGVELDGGAGEPDAGPANEDAGAVADGGVGLDASVPSDAGDGGGATGHCGCEGSGAPPLMLVALLAMLGASRRR